MAARCHMLSLLLALGALAVMAAPVMQISEIEEDHTELLAKLNDELDALVETDEKQLPLDSAPVKKVKPETIDSLLKKAPRASSTMVHMSDIPGYKTTAEDRQDSKDGDHMYKERGTYTPALAARDRKIANEDRLGGKKKKSDPLNHFKDPAQKIARAKKIAADIYNIVNRPIAKKVEETAEQKAIRVIREKGTKDAAFLRRILKKSKADDRRDATKSRKRKRREAKVKANPKLSVGQQIRQKLDSQDHALEKSLDAKRTPEKWAVAEAKRDGDAAQTTKVPTGKTF